MVTVNVFWTRPQCVLRQREVARHLGVRRRRLHEPGEPLRRPARLADRAGGKRVRPTRRRWRATSRSRTPELPRVHWRSGRARDDQRHHADLPEEPRGLDHRHRRERARCASAAWRSTKSSTGSSPSRADGRRSASRARATRPTSVYGFGHPLYYDNVIKVLRGEAEPRDRRPRRSAVARGADRDLPAPRATVTAFQPAAGILKDGFDSRFLGTRAAIVDDGAQIGDGARDLALGARLCRRAHRRATVRSARTSSSATTW